MSDDNQDPNMNKTIMIKIDPSELKGEQPDEQTQTKTTSEPFFGEYYLEMVAMAGTTLKEPKFFKLKEKNTVGRVSGHIVANHPSVSVNHCTLRLENGVLSITDHGSTNGTFVDGQRLDSGQKFILELGDKIGIGQVDFVVTEAKEAQKKKKESESRVKEEQKEQEKQKTQKKKPQATATPKVAGTPFQVKSSSSVSGPVVGVLPRVWAILGDAGVAVAIYRFIASPEQEGYAQSLQDLSSLSSSLVFPYLKILIDFAPVAETTKLLIENLLANIWPFLVLYLLVRIFSNFILGASLSQVLMGLGTQSSFLGARVGGVFRSVLGFILAPFLLFDLPALVNRPTLKEKLTSAPLVVKSRSLQFLGYIAFIPLLFCAPLFAPLISDPFASSGVPLVVVKAEESPQIPEGEKWDSSSLMGISLPLSYFKGQGTWIIPSFHLKREGKDKQVFPALYFINPEIQLQGFLTLKTGIDFQDLLRNAFAHDFFVDLFQSELDQFAKTGGNFPQSLMQNFLQESLRLNYGTLLPFFQEQGPLIGSAVYLRRYFSEETNLGVQMQVENWRLTQKNLFHFFSPHQGNTSYYLPASFSQAPLYEVQWRDGKVADQEKFILNYWQTLKWVVSKEAHTFPQNGTQGLSPLNFWDFFASPLEPANRTTLENYLHQYFYQMGREWLQKGYPVETLASVVNQYLLAYDYLKDQGIPEGRSDFRQVLLDLIAALKDQNKRYFGI